MLLKIPLKNVFPVILCLCFLTGKFPACSLCSRGGPGAVSEQDVVATPDTWCEGFFWALRSVQLLLCWSCFSHKGGGSCPTLSAGTPHRAGAEGSGKAALVLVCQREGWKFLLQIFVTWFSEALGLDAKSSKLRQTNISSTADVLISTCSLLCWLPCWSSHHWENFWRVFNPIVLAIKKMKVT